MATITVSQLTLSEQMKQVGPDGMLMDVVNTLTERNEILMDGIFQEANEAFSNLKVKVLSMSSPTARRINDGSSSGVVKTKRERELVQILEIRPNVDTLLLKGLDGAGAKEKARITQIINLTEKMAQSQADAIIYGDNEDDPDEINGLTARYNTLGTNIVGLGGTGSDTSSIWMVEWHPARCFMIYPRSHASVGIEHEDMGLQVIENATSGRRYNAYEDVMSVAFGWNIIDDTCIQRIANIESTEGESDYNLMATAKINHLIGATNRLPGYGRNAVIYCNAAMKTQFDILGYNNIKNGGITMSVDAFGQPVTLFQNRIPIRLVEALLPTETAIT